MATTYQSSFEDRRGSSAQRSQRLDDASSLVIPHENLEDKIYARLKTLIREQRVAIGVRIQPDHLAREMGVSRTPVLNALKRLAGEQIVEWVPRRGIYLKTLTKRELARVFEVREALECMAARLAATRITREQVDCLAGLFRGIEISSTPEAHALYLERDREFHWQLVMISGNRYLMHAMEAVNVMILTYQYGLNRPMTETIHEHWAILDGLQKQDPDASEAAMRLHVGRTRERIDQLADEEEGLAG
jgi:DNA-binding GntR family transcriptional regulator